MQNNEGLIIQENKAENVLMTLNELFFKISNYFQHHKYFYQFSPLKIDEFMNDKCAINLSLSVHGNYYMTNYGKLNDL